MESKELRLFVHKDLTFKNNGQKDRAATALVKDRNVRNKKNLRSEVETLGNI